MKTKIEVLTEIEKVIEANEHILDCYPATVDINSPMALMQLEATSRLSTLYWVIGENRPKFKCDEWDMADH